jgi:hypothetical protein
MVIANNNVANAILSTLSWMGPNLMVAAVNIIDALDQSNAAVSAEISPINKLCPKVKCKNTKQSTKID